MKNYLAFVEEYKGSRDDFSQFDKVMTLVERTKDIRDGKRSSVSGMDKHKATAVAQYEMAKGIIEPIVEVTDDHTSDDTDYEDY